MMKIENAKITGVRVGFDDRDRLSARLSIKSQKGSTDWGFILTEQAQVQALMELMHYVNVQEIYQLNGKIIRVCIHDHMLRALGDPIEDKFIPLFILDRNGIGEAELIKLLENI